MLTCPTPEKKKMTKWSVYLIDSKSFATMDYGLTCNAGIKGKDLVNEVHEVVWG
jgi:hypothetical protein